MAERIPISRIRGDLMQDSRPWLRSLLVFGLLLVNIALALIASQQKMTLAPLLFLGIGLVILCLRWPYMGLIIASLAGLIVPFYGPSGLNITVILVALLLGLWLLDMIVRQRQIRIVPSRTTWPLLAFLVAAIISFGAGQLPWFTFARNAPLGAQLGGLSIIVLSIGTFLLVANQVRDLGSLSKMTWAFLVLGALFLLTKSILPAWGIFDADIFQTMGSLFFIWLVALAFSQALINRDLHPGWRIALAGLVLITLYFYFYQRFDHKSGWIPLLVCLIVIIGLRSWRAGLVLAAAALLIVLTLSTGLIASEEYSLTTRLDAWSIVFQIIKVNPVFGLGFANYYWYTPLFPISGYEISFNSHNNYVDIIAQTGVVGLVCLLWFFGQVGVLGWQLREKVPPGFAQAYVYGALGGLAGMVVVGMLGDWVLPFFYNIGLNGFRASMLGWLFLGGLVSLEHMTRNPLRGQ